MTEIINANPTILNASDLPTRSSGKSKRKRSFGGSKTGIPQFPSVKALQHDPFATSSAEDSAYSSAVSDSDREDDSSDNEGGDAGGGKDDAAVEEIDEQEIYGR